MVTDNALPFAQQRVAMGNLFPANQVELQESFLSELLAALSMIAKTRDNYYQRAYAQYLFAGVCDASALA